MAGKILIVAAMAAILYNLGAGLYYMMVDNGSTGRTVNALTWRIGLSVGLILTVIFSIWMGWIQPHGIGQ
jgi:succinate dehydrogenase/fumarate reductase cytochrome b subunit